MRTTMQLWALRLPSLRASLQASLLSVLLLNSTPATAQAPVPGDTPPLQQTTAPDYADDTRGIFVPNHKQLRMKSKNELNKDHRQKQLAQATANGSEDFDDFEAEMRRLAGEDENNLDADMNRLSGQGGQQQMQQNAAQNTRQNARQGFARQPQRQNRQQRMQPQGRTSQPGVQQGQRNAQNARQQNAQQNGSFSQQGQSGFNGGSNNGNGVELLRTEPTASRQVDMNNAMVRIREERIAVRRVIQRMMDQIGASDWTIAWDLSQQNRPLTEMEISIDAHEPFIKVLNALLARLQTRSGQPLRVIRYDNTQRLVITDRQSKQKLSGDNVSSVGVETDGEVMVTEQMLKEAMISLHYDEIPLVDALESIVNQAGKGQWRLRVYAGLDQVLKPAHIEEPFSTAMERLLRLFNLKYEVFPGGKLVVITKTNRFGFTAGQ